MQFLCNAAAPSGCQQTGIAGEGVKQGTDSLYFPNIIQHNQHGAMFSQQGADLIRIWLKVLGCLTAKGIPSPLLQNGIAENRVAKFRTNPLKNHAVWKLLIQLRGQVLGQQGFSHAGRPVHRGCDRSF